ncbi:MAG: hypothetical protein O7G87_05585, partial [bacterium]|nr:hypothetical protein [bacterium]
WPAYSSMLVHSSRADYAHLSVAFLIPFIFLLGVNLLFERKGKGLSPSELLTICCTGLVAATTQGEWFAGYFLGVISTPTYFATPENRWSEILLDYIPRWAIVADPSATVGFHESLPKGISAPWEAWMTPFFWWGGFLGALMAANVCLVVILRKQWVEHERLTFPIAQVMLELTGASGTSGRLSVLVRSRLFQTGFWLVLGLLCWNIAGWFITGFPRLPVLTSRNIFIGRGFPQLLFVVHPMTIACGYFTKSEVLFSIWAFHLLAILQAGIFNRVGFDIGGSDPWCSFHPAIGWQSFGGMIVFVVWGLWVARAHLQTVFRKAFGLDESIDDSDEIVSYRTAVWVLLVACIYLILWLHQAGMAWGPLLSFWFGTLVLYLGLARIIVESGLVYLRGPITAQAFTFHLFGIANMGPLSAAALGLTWAFFCDAKTFGITTLAHIPRLGMAMAPRGRRRLVPVVLLSFVIGAVFVIYFTLFHGYHGVGAYNFGGSSFRGAGGGAVESWQLVAGRIQGTLGTDWDRVKFLGVGGVFTGFLLFLRYRFPVFSIHPIGFTIGASLILRSSASSIFLVWLTKAVLLKFGGLERYRKTAPLFLGMLTGHLVGIGLGVLVDVIWFHGDGHPLNRW